jgi:hypothetical protein
MIPFLKILSQDKKNVQQFFFILLYADDTVILAESSDDMQNQINYFYDFCKKWRLKVNIEKSKVLALSIISFLPNPQISHPYNKIGFTILSNKANWHLMDKLCILPFLNTSYKKKLKIVKFLLG